MQSDEVTNFRLHTLSECSYMKQRLSDERTVHVGKLLSRLLLILR